MQMLRFNPNAAPGGSYFLPLSIGDYMYPGQGYMIRVYRECDLLIPSN